MMTGILERARQILTAEAAAIQAVEVNSTFEQAILLMEACKGKIIATGIGKAGYSAKKFAATLCSTGTPAVFMHPAEAAHGDLGVIGPNDCLFCILDLG
jgi:arabinose-5-phosphate isomerase